MNFKKFANLMECNKRNGLKLKFPIALDTFPSKSSNNIKQSIYFHHTNQNICLICLKFEKSMAFIISSIKQYVCFLKNQ